MTPTTVKRAADGDAIIAWDMAKSGLNGNNTGNRFSVCQGHTIFGLTSTTGSSVIKNIGFYESVEAFESATGISAVGFQNHQPKVYGLDGRCRLALGRGVNIVNGRKVLVLN